MDNAESQPIKTDHEQAQSIRQSLKDAITPTLKTKLQSIEPEKFIRIDGGLISVDRPQKGIPICVTSDPNDGGVWHIPYIKPNGEVRVARYREVRTEKSAHTIYIRSFPLEETNDEILNRAAENEFHTKDPEKIAAFIQRNVDDFFEELSYEDES